MSLTFATNNNSISHDDGVACHMIIKCHKLWLYNQDHDSWSTIGFELSNNALTHGMTRKIPKLTNVLLWPIQSDDKW